jgi:hypothetical protein
MQSGLDEEQEFDWLDILGIVAAVGVMMFIGYAVRVYDWIVRDFKKCKAAIYKV